MQLYIPYPNIRRAVQFLDDKRLQKQCVEVVQTLSTSAFMAGAPTAPYKPTHKTHPIVVWCRKSLINYYKTCELAIECFHEYAMRHGRRHKSEQHMRLLMSYADFIPRGDWKGWCNVACNLARGLDYRYLPVHKAYREYLFERYKTDKTAPKCTIPRAHGVDMNRPREIPYIGTLEERQERLILERMASKDMPQHKRIKYADLPSRDGKEECAFFACVQRFYEGKGESVWCSKRCRKIHKLIISGRRYKKRRREQYQYWRRKKEKQEKQRG